MKLYPRRINNSEQGRTRRMIRGRGFIAVTVAAFALFLVVGGSIGLPLTAAATGNTNIQVANLSDQSFGVTWDTASLDTGSSIQYGASCATATNTANEVPSNGYVHLANTPGGLAPNTRYFYKIVAGGVTDNNGGNCYQAQTFSPQAVPPQPETVYGVVGSCTNCTGTLAGSLVMVTLTHSGTVSAPLATIADSNGRWALPFADTTTTAGAYLPAAATDAIGFTGIVDGSHSGFGSVSYNGTAQLVGPEFMVIGPTAARLAWFHAQRSGRFVNLSWRATDQGGLVGFMLFAGKHRLNSRLIPRHATPVYRERLRWTGARRYSLRLVLASGAYLTFYSR